MTKPAHVGTGSSSGETLAAFPSAVPYRGASSSGPHPMTEPVTAFATTYFWLVGPFHDISKKG